MTLTRALGHMGIITRRNLLRNIRIPQLVLFSTVQPVMFLMLFNFVFGGSIAFALPAAYGEYINYLLLGILVQNILFAATATSVGLTEDLQGGVIDRFRSLPMARSAVLAGRTLADTVRSAFVIVLMIIVGYLLGFRPAEGLAALALALLIALMFGYSMSWVMAWVGLKVKTPEAAQSAGFLPIFPLAFASSIFVPIQTLPDWLQGFARNQPVSVVADTARALVLGDPYLVNEGLDLSNLLLKSFGWTFAILAIAVPLSVRTYRRTIG